MEAFPQGPWVSRISAALVLVFGLFIAGAGAYATFAPPSRITANMPGYPRWLSQLPPTKSNSFRIGPQSPAGKAKSSFATTKPPNR